MAQDRYDNGHRHLRDGAIWKDENDVPTLPGYPGIGHPQPQPMWAPSHPGYDDPNTPTGWAKFPPKLDEGTPEERWNDGDEPGLPVTPDERKKKGLPKSKEEMGPDPQEGSPLDVDPTPQEPDALPTPPPDPGYPFGEDDDTGCADWTPDAHVPPYEGPPAEGEGGGGG